MSALRSGGGRSVGGGFALEEFDLNEFPDLAGPARETEEALEP